MDNPTVFSQGDNSEKGMLDSRKFNTEAIDEIFEKQNAQKFKCLDKYFNEEGQMIYQFGSSEDNEHSQKYLRSLHQTGELKDLLSKKVSQKDFLECD